MRTTRSFRSRQCGKHHCPDARFLGFSDASDIRNLDPISRDNLRELGSNCWAVFLRDVNPGLVVLGGELRRALAAGGKFGRQRENGRAIGIAHVPPSALEIEGGSCLT